MADQIKQGDVVAYQTESMADERAGMVVNQNDTAVKLWNGEVIPRTAYLQRLPQSDSRVVQTHIDIADRTGMTAVKIAGKEWVKRKISSNRCFGYLRANWYSPSHEVGAEIWVSGHPETRVTTYDPPMGKFEILSFGPQSREHEPPAGTGYQPQDDGPDTENPPQYEEPTSESTDVSGANAEFDHEPQPSVGDITYEPVSETADVDAEAEALAHQVINEVRGLTNRINRGRAARERLRAIAEQVGCAADKQKGGQ